jgi:hypothetical protein
LPALSADLIGFENLSGLGWSESEFAELENFQNGLGFHSVNSKILEILIRTISYLSQLVYVVSGNEFGLPALSEDLTGFENLSGLVV